MSLCSPRVCEILTISGDASGRYDYAFLFLRDPEGKFCGFEEDVIVYEDDTAIWRTCVESIVEKSSRNDDAPPRGWIIFLWERERCYFKNQLKNGKSCFGKRRYFGLHINQRWMIIVLITGKFVALHN